MGDDDEYATDYEVVDGDASDDHMAAETRGTVPPAWVHPLSSLVTIAVDQVWGLLEIEATLTVAGLIALVPLMLTSGLICLVSVMLIQRYIDHDAWRPAITKAVAMGVLAGVPYPFVGTAAGGALLAWAGIHSVESLVRQNRLSQPK